MAGPLDALERMMEEALEGSVQRLFRPKVQPVQLAKAAARAMEADQVIAPSGPQVPNSYTISLSPQDFDRFGRYQVALQRELEKYLAKYARDHGWRPVAELKVELVADSSVSTGRPTVLAQMLDSSSGSPGADLQPESEVEQTLRQRRVAPLVEQRSDVLSQLVGQRGEVYELGGPVTTLGRALENDVVVDDARVSRYHAEIRRDGNRYLISDLGSTNGTRVANEPIEQRALRDGEVISLGGYQLTFKQS